VQGQPGCPLPYCPGLPQAPQPSWAPHLLEHPPIHLLLPSHTCAQEAARLHSLRHAHIITFYGVSWDEQNSTGCIITEFCSGECQCNT